MSPKKRRIILVDDHGVVREGIKRLLERHADIEVVGECHDGREALQQIQKLRPDVVMMDISMPGMSGFEATRSVKQSWPETRVIALTVHEDDAYIREMLEAGAVGYLLKRAPTEELVRAVRVVADGGTYIDPRVADTVVKAMTQPSHSATYATLSLSEREAAVLRAIALGYSNKEIADQLKLSVKTVETYKARAMEKFGLKSRVEIVRLAAQRGWLKV